MTTINPWPTILTAKEAAAILRVSPATVVRLCRSGKLRALPIPGRILLTADTLRTFVAAPREPRVRGCDR